MLGHFPSERTGASLFSIVHAKDVTLLESVHRELRAGCALVRSAGLRLVTYDRRVCTVDSEWAAFTNPWSGHVEMVVAKHTVTGYSQLDEPGTAVLSAEQCRQHDANIRAILENVSRTSTCLHSCLSLFVVLSGIASCITLFMVFFLLFSLIIFIVSPKSFLSDFRTFSHFPWFLFL